MSGIAITRRDLTAGALRGAAGKRRDARAARRMPALAPVLEGADRTRAAGTCGKDLQTLRDGMHRDLPHRSADRRSAPVPGQSGPATFVTGIRVRYGRSQRQHGRGTQQPGGRGPAP